MRRVEAVNGIPVDCPVLDHFLGMSAIRSCRGTNHEVCDECSLRKGSNREAVPGKISGRDDESAAGTNK
ncbi:MAG: hypothetical protein ACOX6N_01670 [Patescibacteria group bacterium]|jgi:hypothetical protein